MAFSIIVFTSDMDIAILGVQKLAFGSLGGHCGSLGTPWGTIGAAGRTRGFQNRIFSHFEMNLRSHFESCLGSDWLSCVFLFGLVSWPLFASIFSSNS